MSQRRATTAEEKPASRGQPARTAQTQPASPTNRPETRNRTLASGAGNARAPGKEGRHPARLKYYSLETLGQGKQTLSGTLAPPRGHPPRLLFVWFGVGWVGRADGADTTPKNFPAPAAGYGGRGADRRDRRSPADSSPPGGTEAPNGRIELGTGPPLP